MTQRLISLSCSSNMLIRQKIMKIKEEWDTGGKSYNMRPLENIADCKYDCNQLYFPLYSYAASASLVVVHSCLQ